MAREIDSLSGVPVYRQLADILRARIVGGEWRPGQRLPSEADLAHEYGIGVDSVRAAMRILREDGLVETRRPQGSFVRERPDTGEPVLLPAGADVWLQVATDGERRRFGLPPGASVVFVHYRAETRVYGPGTRFKVAWRDTSAPPNHSQ